MAKLVLSLGPAFNCKTKMRRVSENHKHFCTQLVVVPPQWLLLLGPLKTGKGEVKIGAVGQGLWVMKNVKRRGRRG